MFFRKRQDQGLEDRLRGLSAEPRDDFVRSLATEVRSSRVRTAMRSRRVLAAVVTSGLMLIPFAAFGGVGYAASGRKERCSVCQQRQQGQRQRGQQQQGQRQQGNNNKGNDNKGNNNKGNGNEGDNNKGHGNKPDDDQYKPGKGCGDKNHEHERKNECKKPPHDH